MKTRHFFWLGLSVVALALSACQAALTPSPSKPADIQITLGSPSEFAIQSSLTSFTVGVPYHFVVTNKGAVAHEFMIMPPVQGGHMSMEEMDKMALAMMESEDLPPGATKSLDYTFTQAASVGTLEFACHEPGHYEAGMKLPVVVK